jgi:hypothetical protein
MACDPISGEFLFSNETGMCDGQHLDNMQSGACCFPILAVIVKDNKDTYKSIFVLYLSSEKNSTKKDVMTVVKAGSSSW